MSLTQIKLSLQELKLYGMMENLDDVFNQMNRQSITGLEALDLLLQKEKQLRESKSMQSRVQRSKIRKGASLEDYDLTHKRNLSRDQLRELASFVTHHAL